MIFFGLVFYSYSLCILLHETVYPREIDVGGGTHREWENKQTNEQKRKCFRSIMVVFCYVWRCYTNNIKWQGYKKVYTHAISRIKQKNQNNAKDCTNEPTNRKDENERKKPRNKKKLFRKMFEPEVKKVENTRKNIVTNSGGCKIISFRARGWEK